MIKEQPIGTTDCDTCYGTAVIDHAGSEIACPDCRVDDEKPSKWIVHITWIRDRDSREFTRNVKVTASTIAEACDKGAHGIPFAGEIVDHYAEEID